ncbi:condensation domain-containing protein [Streptomyces sp. B3I8]|uniref:condensation domain-containing protein n=1 Tax=Streptomyces sp. B3I8 TaxID=3042303 RepID=UPI00277FAE38|nr:condensation domain-containing protein [Streptomyces sp. B3I8]MDQ0786681.1 hypothetical protein [Streptomyces sp. B3I8]
MTPFDLTRSQQIIWLHEELFPRSHAYNFSAVLDLRGPLDEQALRDSLAGVLQRHEGLRLELVPGGLPPRQRVNSTTTPRYRTADLSSRDDPDAACHEIVLAQHNDPFDLTEAPLARWCLVSLGDKHHRLVHTEHHLIHDGWSFSVFLRDLFTLYRGLTGGAAANLPTPRSFADHARGFAAEPDGYASHESALRHWRTLLEGAEFGLAFPGRAPAERRRESPDGAQTRHVLDPELAEDLRARARRDGHTPYVVLLTLYAELLRRHTGRDDMVIGSAVGNRPTAYRHSIGMFVNTVPLRVRLRPGRPAGEAVDDAVDMLMQALPHQHLPVQELARELGVHSRTGVDTPLFQVMFSAHDAPLPVIEGLDVHVSFEEALNGGTSRFDLDVVVLPDSRRTVNPRTGPAGMTLIWDYATDLFDEAAVRVLQSQYTDLLRDYARAPGTPLSAIAPHVTSVHR